MENSGQFGSIARLLARIKREHGISLAKLPEADEFAHRLRQRHTLAVLNDEDPLAFEKLRAGEARQGAQTLLAMAVGRVKKTDFKFFAGTFELGQCPKHRHPPNLPIEEQAERKSVLANQGGGPAVGLDKDDAASATAARLQSYRAATGVAIKKRAVVHPARQDVKQGFSQPIARRPQIQPWQSPKASPAQCAGNDAHGSKSRVLARATLTGAPARKQLFWRKAQANAQPTIIDRSPETER